MNADPQHNPMTKLTHPVREGRTNHITTQGHMAARRPSHEATEDAERNNVGLLDDDVHVLINDGSVFQVK